MKKYELRISRTSVIEYVSSEDIYYSFIGNIRDYNSIKTEKMFFEHYNNVLPNVVKLEEVNDKNNRFYVPTELILFSKSLLRYSNLNKLNFI